MPMMPLYHQNISHDSYTTGLRPDPCNFRQACMLRLGPVCTCMRIRRRVMSCDFVLSGAYPLQPAWL